jgi:NDP-sugar pyrophosphorylase family protein
LGYKKGENIVRGFSKNPVLHENEINGGFYYFNKKFLAKKYLNSKSGSLEEKPLEILTRDLKLGFYEHEGLWQHLDNFSDIEKIRNEATEISKLIDKSNFDVNKLKIQYNSFFKAYPILFDNLISKKMTLEELNILLNTLANAQEHFFKSI